MERIGHYTIVSELGRGGMGVVYKAHEESLNRYVAIKVLGEHLESDNEYVERFIREAKSAAALSHPNIVQIYSISEEAGHHYFVMEYVQGTSVEQIIRTKGKISTADASRFVLQAAAGLQEAHGHGVIHRDIKPANLMVTNRGLVKIADFGLALMGSATARLTATGMLMGTPGYLSPEQCLDQSPDHRTDIYSLGVAFFEMVTGTMPFKADSPLALLKQIVEVDPPDIRELNPDVDDVLRNVIAKMTAKDREQRFASCSEIISELQHWLEARGEPLQNVAAGTSAGVLPPPPPLASDEQINTDPTIAVDSGATGEPTVPPAPPTVGTIPAAPAETAPAGETDPDETFTPHDSSGNRTGLIAAAIVLFILAGSAVAAVIAVKSGLLDAIFNRNGQPLVAESDGPTLDEATSASAEGDATAAGGTTGTESTGPFDDAATTTTDGDPAAAAGSTADTQQTIGGEPVAATISQTSGTSADSGREPGIASPSAAAATAQGDSAVADTTAVQPPEPKITAPPPTGTVVVAVGDRLLASEAERYVAERLRRAGVEVIDITQIPGLAGFISTEARPDPGRIRDILRPHARYLVPIRVENLGSREIVYMGQRDLVHQVRVNIAAVDLAGGQPLGRPNSTVLEFTQLNADQKVSNSLRRYTTKLIALLPRR